MARTGMILSLGLGIALLASGCSVGGSNVKLDAGKMQSLHKVALVGVCLQSDMATIAGTKDIGTIVGGGKMLLGPLVESVNATLPEAWKAVEVVPLAPSSEAAGRPVGEHRVCANNVDPMMVGGFVGTPDLGYLGTVAAKLDVDAVLVISGAPATRFWKGKGAKLYVASIGDGFQATLVDRAGAEIASIQLRDFETDYSPEVAAKHDFVNVRPLGMTIGKLLAEGLAAKLQGKEWNPPSRPGMSGL